MGTDSTVRSAVIGAHCSVTDAHAADLKYLLVLGGLFVWSYNIIRKAGFFFFFFKSEEENRSTYSHTAQLRPLLFAARMATKGVRQ